MLADLIRKRDYDALFTFGAAALGHLGPIVALPWFFILGIVFTAGTLFVGISHQAPINSD